MKVKNTQSGSEFNYLGEFKLLQGSNHPRGTRKVSFFKQKEKHRSNKCVITDPLKPARLGAKRESERDSEVVRELAGGGEDSAALQPGLQPALWRGLSLALSII
jgi:hypothetical protein